MKLKIIALITVFIIFQLVGKAQKAWDSGQLISRNGDTIQAKIFSNHTSWKVKAMLENGILKRYSASDIQGFNINGKDFKSLSKGSRYSFYKTITDGELPLYTLNSKLFTSNINLAVQLTKSNYKKEINRRYEQSQKIKEIINDSTTTYDNFIQKIIKLNFEYKDSLKNLPENSVQPIKELSCNTNYVCNGFAKLDSIKSPFIKFGIDGLSLEHKIIRSFTLFARLGLSNVTYTGGGEPDWRISSLYLGQIRYYPGLKDRIRKGRTIETYSGTYIAPSFITYTEPKDIVGGALILGGQWFTKNKLFYYGYDFGIGIADAINHATYQKTLPFFLYGIKIGVSPFLVK